MHKIDENKKKIITYNRIWLVRLIAMIISLLALKQLVQSAKPNSGINPLNITFYSRYSSLCSLEEYYSEFMAKLCFGLEVFFIGTIVFYVIAWIMQYINQKTSARIDIITDISVIIILMIDFLCPLYCFKAYIYAEQHTILYFIRIAAMLVILMIHFDQYRRNKELFNSESKAVFATTMTLQMAFFVVALIFVGNNIKIYNDYKYFYGKYATESHSRNIEVEDKILNYRECAVANGEEIYFYNDIDEQKSIDKVDTDGNISTLISFEEIKAALNLNEGDRFVSIKTLDYYDGYLYITIFITNSNGLLGRVNVETGEFEKLQTDAGRDIVSCAVKDGYLYYEYIIENNFYGRYNVYRVKIEDTFDISKEELYLGRYKAPRDYWISWFYNTLIYDEYCYFAEEVYDEYDYRRVKKNEYAYTLKDRDDEYLTLIRYKEKDHKKLIKECNLADYYAWDGNKVDDYDIISENVLQYNVYGEKLFYLRQIEDRTELVQVDLDGNNEKVLAEYEDFLPCYDGQKYIGVSIIVCENKVMVIYPCEKDERKLSVVSVP